MVVRGNFQTELEQLKNMLLELGKKAETAMNRAIEALKTQNVDDAIHIIEDDAEINVLEDEINDLAILMIAKQQPVATDLRRIIVALRISTDLERVGDLAVNIAKSVIRIGDGKLIKPIEEIPRMAAIAQKMNADVLEAFYKEDVDLAKKVAEIDDQVDDMYGRLVQELLELMTQNPDFIRQITQLAFICRYIERYADHATNISESVIYLVKGKHYDLNA
ncbi:phosphate signaling complex protein PhoU [Pseudalkalibacillus caeni]|nr:phosphate signaling complex protein PhoU [Pseudalkalibacillus caeni]